MARSIDLSIDGMKPLMRALRQIPDAMRSKVMLPAAAKAGRLIADSIRPLIPLQAKTKARGRSHYRYVLTSATREYQKTQSVVSIVGPESRMAPHANLVEDGTQQRFTNQKTKYARMAVGARWKIVKGKPQLVIEKQRKAVGTVKRRKTKPYLNRGRMPAFKPIERGAAAAQATIASSLQRDIASGITRELTAAKLARGR